MGTEQWIVVKVPQDLLIYSSILDGYVTYQAQQVRAMLTALCKELHPVLLYHRRYLVGLLKFRVPPFRAFNGAWAI